jgi:3-keto-L-gulonate-6-phosphate decarboxylase
MSNLLKVTKLMLVLRLSLDDAEFEGAVSTINTIARRQALHGIAVGTALGLAIGAIFFFTVL